MIRIMLNLSPEERSALSELAKQELRSPRDQLRMILRYKLLEHGLLVCKEYQPQKETASSNAPAEDAEPAFSYISPQ